MYLEHFCGDGYFLILPLYYLAGCSTTSWPTWSPTRQVHRDSTPLLALSTVALADVESGTMVVAERGRGADDIYLQDLTGVFAADGGFLFLYARTPSEKVDVAAQLAVDYIQRCCLGQSVLKGAGWSSSSHMLTPKPRKSVKTSHHW